MLIISVEVLKITDKRENCDNAIEKVILDTFKIEKPDEGNTLKREASL